MTEAERLCCAENLPFGKLFRYQYVLSRWRMRVSNMAQRPFGKFQLYTGEALPITELFDCAGEPIGLLLGVAVAREGALGAQHIIPGLSVESLVCLEEFEDWLVDLSGRYTILLDMAGEQRVYSDPAGSNGGVYCHETQRFASSPLLCIDRPVIPNPLQDADVIRETGGRFTLFTTIDAEVTRMNPNFYLDLANFHEERHWPRGEVFDHSPKDYGRVFDEIALITERIVGDLTANHDCVLPLTAGRDSRLLFAMSGRHQGDFQQVYTHITNSGTRRDSEVAAKLCEVAGVDHQVHNRPALTDADQERLNSYDRAYQIGAGVVTHAPTEMVTGLQEQIPADALVLRGHQLDFMRALFVRWTDKAKWKDFNWQMRRLLPVPGDHFTPAVAEKLRPLFARWQQTLPRAAREKQPDFLFLEVARPSSIGTGFPANWHCFYMCPFNSRRLIALTLGLDDKYRLSGKAVDDLLYRLNPDLAAVPFALEWQGQDAEPEQAEQRVVEARARHGAIFGGDRVRKTA